MITRGTSLLMVHAEFLAKKPHNYAYDNISINFNLSRFTRLLEDQEMTKTKENDRHPVAVSS
jgi:hypothetical protein